MWPNQTARKKPPVPFISCLGSGVISLTTVKPLHFICWTFLFFLMVFFFVSKHFLLCELFGSKTNISLRYQFFFFVFSHVFPYCIANSLYHSKFQCFFSPSMQIIYVLVLTIFHSRIRSHIFYWSMSVFYAPHFIGKQLFFTIFSHHTRSCISNDNKIKRNVRILNVAWHKRHAETCDNCVFSFAIPLIHKSS